MTHLERGEITEAQRVTGTALSRALEPGVAEHFVTGLAHALALAATGQVAQAGPAAARAVQLARPASPADRLAVAILTRSLFTRVKPHPTADPGALRHQRGCMPTKDYQPAPAPSATATNPAADHDLVEALRRRDDNTYRTLVRRHTPLMLRLARQYVPSQAIAEEVVQDTWVAVLRGIDAFQGRCQFTTWLMRILVNTARKRGVREHTPARWDALSVAGTTAEPAWAPELSPEAVVLATETRTLLEQAIRTLPERQRAVLVLRDVDGWPAEEVCAALEVSTGNQRVLLHRARSAMRSALHPQRNDLVPV